MSQSETPFHFPTQQHFECTDCGKCCTTPWDIGVSQELVRGIKGSPTGRALRKSGYRAVRVIDKEYTLDRDESGACRLFIDEGCAVHREIGGEKKPYDCQRYPFEIVPTPAGNYVSLVYSCPAVVAGVGRHYQAYEQEMKALARRAGEKSQPMAPDETSLSLTSAQSANWTEYCGLESTILGMLNPVNVFPGLVSLACRAIGWAEGERDGCLSHIKHNSQLQIQALEMVQCVAVHFISVTENPNDPEARSEFTEALESAEGAFSKRLETQLPPFQIEVLGDTLAEDITFRFVGDFLLGKRLWSQNLSLVSSLLLLSTSLAVVAYYYKALKAKDSQAHFSFDHLSEALDVVEGGLLSHSEDFDPYFKTIGEALEKIYQASPEG